MRNDIRVSVKHLTEPPTKGDGLFQIYVDHWWIVDEDDRVIFHRGLTPQCNDNPAIVRRLQFSLHPNAFVVRLHLVYVPMRMVTHSGGDYEMPYTDLEPRLEHLIS